MRLYVKWVQPISHIAFVSHRDGNAATYMMDAVRSKQINLTRDLALDNRPAWSLDGTKLVLYSDRGGDRIICVIITDELGMVRTTDDGANHHSP